MDKDLLCVDSLKIFKEIFQNSTPDVVVNPFQLLNETTPRKRPFHNTTPRKQPFYNTTPENTPSNVNSPKKCKLDLTSIYTRLCGEKPIQSHTAESDVTSLLRAGIHTAEEFLNGVEKHAILFSEVKKCW